MTAICLRSLPAAPEPVTQPPLLALLRLAALECRAARHCGPHEACALLDPSAGAEIHAAALARVLPAIALRRPVIWAPGSAGRSFDEAWLLACDGALRRGDGASFRFLCARRLHPGGATRLRPLLTGLSTRLDTKDRVAS
jgi:hypothetical protein